MTLHQMDTVTMLGNSCLFRAPASGGHSGITVILVLEMTRQEPGKFRDWIPALSHFEFGRFWNALQLRLIGGLGPEISSLGKN